MKNIAIHGSSGWLGRAALYFFLEKNIENFILTSNNYSKIMFDDKTYPLIDNNEFSKIQNQEINILYVFGFPMDKLKNKKKLKVEFDKMMNEIEIFLKNNLVHKVFLASSGVVGFQTNSKYNIYSHYKKEQEKKLKEFCDDMQITLEVCRFFSVIAPFYDLSKDYALTSFIKSGQNGEEILISNGDATRSYVNFEDVINFSFENSVNKTYDARTINMSINDLAKIVSEIFNVDLKVKFEKDNKLSNYISDEDYFISNMRKITPINIASIKKIIDITKKTNFELIK